MKREVKKVVKEREEKDSLFNEIKSQAAMEYLMTYGWAILIIALTLAVLYSLGIMNQRILFQELHQVLALFLDQTAQEQQILFLCKEPAAIYLCMLQASTEIII